MKRYFIIVLLAVYSVAAYPVSLEQLRSAGENARQTTNQYYDMAKKINTTPNNEPIKIGRLRMPIAKAIGRKSADIYVMQNYLQHINNEHPEFKKLGLTAFLYIKSITDNFNQIHKGSGTSLLLVVFNGDKNPVVAVDMNYSIKRGAWEVKTAQIRREKDIKKSEMLWEKP